MKKQLLKEYILMIKEAFQNGNSYEEVADVGTAYLYEIGMPKYIKLETKFTADEIKEFIEKN